MSATHEQRVWRWGAWWGTHQRADMAVVGYRHHGCGAATLVDFSSHEGYDGTCCSGCRVEIQRPATECSPLFEAPDIGSNPDTEGR